MKGNIPYAAIRRLIYFKGRWTSWPKRRSIRMHTLLYIKQGQGEIRVDGNAYLVAPRSWYLLKPGMVVEERLSSRYESEVYIIPFYLQQVTYRNHNTEVAEYDTSSFPTGNIKINHEAQLDSMLEQLHRPEGEEEFMQQWQRQLTLSQLLHALVTSNAKAEEGFTRKMEIRHCVAYLSEHFAEPVRMDKLAELYHMNSSTFSRWFKKEIGMNPSDYLLHVRIKEAKTLLSGTKRMREVAVRTGFCDEYYFSRMFKKVVGLSPTAYARLIHVQAHTTNERLPELEPVNVAVTYVDEVDHLISLGLLPAAVPYDRMLSEQETTIPYLKNYIGHLPHIGSEQTLNRLMLGKLNPELIIAGRFMKDWGNVWLDEIAPTHYYIWEVDWRNVHRELATKLSRESAAEQNIERYERLVQQARELMFRSCLGKSFVFLEMTRHGIRVSPYTSNGGWLLYQQLGFTPSSVVTVNDWGHYIEPEEAASLKVDYWFISKRSGSAAVYERFINHPHTQRILPRLIDVPRYPWSKGGPLAYAAGVRLIVNQFKQMTR